MKELTNLKGAKTLNRDEQKSINGGRKMREMSDSFSEEMECYCNNYYLGTSSNCAGLCYQCVSEGGCYEF